MTPPELVQSAAAGTAVTSATAHVAAANTATEDTTFEIFTAHTRLHVPIRKRPAPNRSHAVQIPRPPTNRRCESKSFDNAADLFSTKNFRVRKALFVGLM